MKTSTFLPFFMWRTNGTTRRIPKTLPPKLYQVVGTLFPPVPLLSGEEETTTVGANITGSDANETTISVTTETLIDKDISKNSTAENITTVAE
ncbi:unnamed protein product [Leptosia nina]|uniref:Uncharacterized protein n=1 Tax=Leptosia nina TaxID=320188 RepID=A0AAV1JKB7_9NEOP